MLMRMIGFYVDNLPTRNIDRMLITVEGRVVLEEETVKKGDGGMDNILLFDLESAWASMGLTAPWSGDVDVILWLD